VSVEISAKTPTEQLSEESGTIAYWRHRMLSFNNIYENAHDIHLAKVYFFMHLIILLKDNHVHDSFSCEKILSLDNINRRINKLLQGGACRRNIDSALDGTCGTCLYRLAS